MITMEYFGKDDIEIVMKWACSPRFLMQWAGPTFSYPLTKEQLMEYISKANQTDSTRYVFKIIQNNTREVIGHLSIGAVNRYNRSARIGKVIIDEKYRGLGYGKQVIKEAIHFGFDRLGLHRISLGVWDFNEQALVCYKKIGFIEEGRKRDFRRFENEYWTLVEMSMLEDEWKEIKDKERQNTPSILHS